MSAVLKPSAPVDLGAVKVRQQAAWATGNYSVVGTTLQIVGENLCEALDLRAGTRVLALTLPKPGQPVRSSIDPAVQRAAVAAKGERLGGVAVVRPRTGEILALAGLAF